MSSSSTTTTTLLFSWLCTIHQHISNEHSQTNCGLIDPACSTTENGKFTFRDRRRSHRTAPIRTVIVPDVRMCRAFSLVLFVLQCDGHFNCLHWNLQRSTKRVHVKVGTRTAGVYVRSTIVLAAGLAGGWSVTWSALKRAGLVSPINCDRERERVGVSERESETYKYIDGVWALSIL